MTAERQIAQYFVWKKPVLVAFHRNTVVNSATKLEN